MPAKKTAPKAAKGKKAVSRPAVRKTSARKPVERAKAVAHVRKTAAAATRKAAPHRQSPTSTETTEMRKTAAVEQAPAPEAPESPPAEDLVPPNASEHLNANDSTDTSDSSDVDDSDAPEPGSLLAGPRNVKPYIVKRGEQYMSKEQLEHFRQILLNWKRDLMEEVDRTVSHMKDEAANFPDPNDRATQEEEFSIELRTRDRERKLIRKIDEALKRIEDGTYGYCLETGEEIGIKRLEARPVATLCLEAQERRERRERQYGDRDDRYR
jgi:RNA polymerase-binding protein DksA